jgi:hypothetical protein
MESNRRYTLPVNDILKAQIVRKIKIPLDHGHSRSAKSAKLLHPTSQALGVSSRNGTSGIAVGTTSASVFEIRSAEMVP